MENTWHDSDHCKKIWVLCSGNNPSGFIGIIDKVRPTVWNCKKILSGREQENKQLNLTSYVLQKLIT